MNDLLTLEPREAGTVAMEPTVDFSDTVRPQGDTSWSMAGDSTWAMDAGDTSWSMAGDSTWAMDAGDTSWSMAADSTWAMSRR
ncbi:hypothetical protein GCM10029978_024450 [Actinoallomurus acanthiterrae]